MKPWKTLRNKTKKIKNYVRNEAHKKGYQDAGIGIGIGLAIDITVGATVFLTIMYVVAVEKHLDFLKTSIISFAVGLPFCAKAIFKWRILQEKKEEKASRIEIAETKYSLYESLVYAVFYMYIVITLFIISAGMSKIHRPTGKKATAKTLNSYYKEIIDSGLKSGEKIFFWIMISTIAILLILLFLVYEKKKRISTSTKKEECGEEKEKLGEEKLYQNRKSRGMYRHSHFIRR